MRRVMEAFVQYFIVTINFQRSNEVVFGKLTVRFTLEIKHVGIVEQATAVVVHLRFSSWHEVHHEIAKQCVLIKHNQPPLDSPVLFKNDFKSLSLVSFSQGLPAFS